MDLIDKKILSLLQSDATAPITQIASKVGLSTTPCWRRIQKLEKDGIIRARVALLNAEKLNAGVTVFVSIKTNKHDASWFQTFSRAVNAFPEVVEFYRMSGDVDYLLRVVVSDIAAYDEFYQRLIEQVELSDVSSSFSMEELKYTTALPLVYA
mgnify:CR=1 FL=1|tara:strand:- start:618 stop:1076 length:459 start_codon:yes stop_codon:yes gene_type:complete